MAGLDPEVVLEQVVYADVDRRSSLLAAAGPVLDDLRARLEGTGFCTLLVDRDGRVAHRWCDGADAFRAFDDLGVDVGASLIEEAVGTNAPGTVLETRRSISVNGSEHFAVPLRRFSCYGHPIFHPTTRRMEGVLDLTALSDVASPLLAPIVARAVADIEQRLLDGSRVSDKQLLAAFQAAGGRRRAVVAVGHDLLMSNQAAIDLLSSTDVALLRMIASEVVEDAFVDLNLESGTQVQVRATRVSGARGGALLHVEPHQTVRAQSVPAPGVARQARPEAPVLVFGPPGSGRTTRAHQLAEGQAVTVLSAASALLEGPATWAREFGALVRAGRGTVCVDGIDLLPDQLVDLVRAHAADRRAPRIIVVSGPLERLDQQAAALAGLCLERVELAPLAHRLADLPELVSTMMRDLGASTSLHLTPGALCALSSQPWPGNLRELRAVIEHVVERRTSGGVVVEDLPEAYRSQERSREMAPIARAERDAIIAALRDHEGNKVRAAEALGISRTTLYAKMRALRITTY